MLAASSPKRKFRINIVRYRDEIKTNPVRITFKGRNGHELYMLMTIPEKVSAVPLPALVWIYGGGWRDDNSWRYPPHLRYSTDRGAIGIVLSYRCIPPANAPEKEKRKIGIRECINDCVDGFLHIRKNAKKYGINPNRIALLGDSAGGHLAGWLALAAPETSGKAAALVNCCGVMDLTNQKWKDNFSHFSDPEAEAKKLSPIFNLRRSSCQVFNLSGNLDPVVPSPETKNFHRACLRKGIASEYHDWDDVGHAFILPDYHATDEQVSRALRAIDRFLVRNKILEPLKNSVARKQKVFA